MEFNEDELFLKNAKQCIQCMRKTLVLWICEYEFTCIASGYSVIKQKNELKKFSRENMNSSNRLKMVNIKYFAFD